MTKKNILIITILLVLTLIIGACSAGNSKNSADSKSESDQTEPKDSSESQNVEVITKNEETTNTSEKADNKNDSPTDEKATVSDSNSQWLFETTDLAGNTLNSKDFYSNAKLTLVNVWATWCPPCKAELPDLGKIAKEYADKDFQILGIASDVSDGNGVLEVAESILNDSNVEYTNAMLNEQLLEVLGANNITALPTSVLVNSNGEIVGDQIIGMRSYEDFTKIIDAALSEIN